MRELFIARFKHAPGRFLVWRNGLGYEGRKIAASAKRQASYGNKPDPETGLHLNEMWGWWTAADLVSLKPFRKGDYTPSGEVP